MKTVQQALKDEIHSPIPMGYVENVCIKRGINPEEEFSGYIASQKEYKGAVADCLFSLVQAVNFSEADKSIGALTDGQRKLLLRRANGLYKEIGEDEVYDGSPTVYINC